MNDLAEQALHGLDEARKQIVKHPLTSLAVGGFLLSAVVVVSGGRVGTNPATTPLTHWLGLLPDNGTGDDRAAGAIMFAAIVTLLVLWLVAVARLRQGACSERQAWTLAGIWSVPFAVGPPVLSGDLYTYVGQGLLARSGADPYAVGPAHLGDNAIVAAIDPARRGTASTSGALGTLVEHLAVSISGGHAFAALLVLRVLGIACVVVIAMLAAELAGPYRVPAIALTALNPALTLFVLSSFHLDGLVAALILGTLVATAQRRRVLAVVLAAAAGAIKPAVLPVLPVVVFAHCAGLRRRSMWRIAARDVAAAVVSLAVFTLVVPDGLGWRHNVSTVTLDHTPFAPASIVSNVVRPIVSAASEDDLAIGGRIAVILAAIGIVLYLLVSVRRRPLNRTVGYVLLTVGACSPVLYPWSLVAGICALAPSAEGVRRDWVLALSCAACVLVPVGMREGVAHEISLIALLVIALGLLLELRRRQREQSVSGGSAPLVRPATGRS
jgi:hypothetical protein